ncbi:hypothetical protein CMV_005578 [Castanea mollissima]|uniref:BED-type domain-containing protein n=1 Tax=Castanea mollissima TaxID=60419 RepID=A0A8J4VS87_9ROSI|nr:hypothetical protein CMV_005578 [Castanea mollissima]
MATGLEHVPVTPQKQDPAWKHCRLFKNGDRSQLKCIYCNKLFRGGGIHRIKEHLAGQKGNASACLRVPPDVRVSMQQSLDGAVVKKRRKQRIEDEILNVNAVSHELDAIVNQSDASTGLQLTGVSDAIEPNSNLLVSLEGTGGGERRKKERVRSSFTNAANVDATGGGTSSVALGSKRVNNHVNMAIGRFLYDIGAPLDAVNSAYFKPMIDAIATARDGVVPPSYHDIRGWILKNSVEEVKNDIDKIKATWGTTESGVTRSATNFTTLKRMVNLKHNLQAMVTSQEWMDCPYSKKTEGLRMLDIVTSQSFWSSCILIIQLTNPLLQLLRIAGSEKRPAMGYIYAGIYRAKETIKKELLKRVDYVVYWNIIDYRARDTLLPADWWSTYGGSCPNLARLAIRILSQTCSSIGSRRNHMSYEQTHETRNYLERQRLTDLVFVQYNLRLGQLIKSEEQDLMDPISFVGTNVVEDWIMGKDVCVDDYGSINWMSVDPPSANSMLLGSSNDAAEDLGSGFDDHEILNRGKEGEEKC